MTPLTPRATFAAGGLPGRVDKRQRPNPGASGRPSSQDLRRGRSPLTHDYLAPTNRPCDSS